jgi:hypothetical protein
MHSTLNWFLTSCLAAIGVVVAFSSFIGFKATSLILQNKKRKLLQGLCILGSSMAVIGTIGIFMTAPENIMNPPTKSQMLQWKLQKANAGDFIVKTDKKSGEEIIMLVVVQIPMTSAVDKDTKLVMFSGNTTKLYKISRVTADDFDNVISAGWLGSNEYNRLSRIFLSRQAEAFSQHLAEKTRKSFYTILD